VVVSAATPKATRLAGAEAALTGAPVADMARDDMAGGDGALGRASAAAAAEADTMADVRGSASYKRELLRVYVRRAVRAALALSPAAEGSH
jgi:carbon-monoxide dehydrogenase medium subunit